MKRTLLAAALVLSLGACQMLPEDENGEGNHVDSTKGLQADVAQVVFTAGGKTASDTRTLTLSNSGEATVTISSFDLQGQDAAQYSLPDVNTPLSLTAGESVSLKLSFRPDGIGPRRAELVISSDDARTPTLSVPLGGLGVKGQGGNLEPSLQWVFDAFGLPINSGDGDPNDTPLVAGATNALVGEEVSAQRFTKAGTGPVTLEVLATFGVENDPVLEFGWYTAGDTSTRQSLFEIQQIPTLNAQRLAPKVDGELSFDPGVATFGLYSFWPGNRFFSERHVYTENKLNTFADAVPHQVRAYPLKDADGSFVQNAYILATEEFSQGFDYNDVVLIVRNVKPSSGDSDNLLVRNTLGLPYANRVVLHRINNTSGNLCNPELDPTCDVTKEPWTSLMFHDTGTLALENTGSTPLQLNLDISAPDDFVLPNGETTLTLEPGDPYNLTVQFVRNSGEKGVYSGILNLQTGDGQTAEVELAGVYMNQPEGSREVFLAPLMNEAFGYTTDFGANASGGISGSDANSALKGDEVRSDYWERADSSDPVTVQQLAAFHGCCRAADVFEFFYQGNSSSFASFRHDAADGQTVFPRIQNGPELAGVEVKTNRPFEMRSQNYSSDPSKGRGVGNLGLRFWPAIDRSGHTIANTYIAAQDNVFNGCGEGETDQGLAANCDYNDNIYLISNIRPVAN